MKRLWCRIRYTSKRRGHRWSRWASDPAADVYPDEDAAWEVGLTEASLRIATGRPPAEYVVLPDGEFPHRVPSEKERT